VYLSKNIEISFAEVELRNVYGPGSWPINEARLRQYQCAKVIVREPLAAVNLCRGGLIEHRIPTDVAKAEDHTMGRLWSLALWQHPDHPDAIHYPSRLVDGPCLAIYDRALPKLTAMAVKPLMDYRKEMATIIHKYRLSLTP